MNSEMKVDAQVKIIALQEVKEYTDGQLSAFFPVKEDREKLINFFREDLELSCKKGSEKYSFSFVGLVEYDGQKNRYLIFFYPKYMKFVKPDDPPGKDFLKSFSLAFKALSRHQKYSEGNINPDETSKRENLLSLAVELVQDYLQNGVYTNTITRSELCGQGEIDWQKTIDTVLPVIRKKRPVYVQYHTNERVSHSNTLIAGIHECIVSECSRIISENYLAELLGVETPVPYEGVLSDFGDYDAILYLIDRELSVQFVTQKQNLLKMMKLFIKACMEKEDKDKSDYACEDNLLFYGIKSFHVVWEAACSAVFGDQKDKDLKGGEIKCPRIRDIMKKNKIGKWKDFIPNVEWKIRYNVNEDEKAALRPDFLALIGKNFYILDAKYYCPVIEKNHVGDGKRASVSGVPGVGDIDKQHLYQLAYAPLARAEDWKMFNAFLMPREQKDSADSEESKCAPEIGECVGIAYNPIFGYINQFEFVPIQVFYLDPDKLLEDYVNNKEEEVNKLFEEPKKSEPERIPQNIPCCMKTVCTSDNCSVIAAGT